MTGGPVPRTGRLLAGRLGSVAGSLVVGQILVGLTYVLSARQMEPAELGLVTTCFAIATVAATIFDVGLTGYSIREVGGGDMTFVRARQLVTAKRRLVPLLVAPTLAASLLIMRLPVEGLVLGTVAWAVWEAQTANSLLRMQERFTEAVSAQLLGRSSGLAAVVGLLIIMPAQRALAIGLATSFAVEAAIGYAVLQHNRHGAAYQRDLLSVHRRSLSFGIVALAGIGQQLDTPAVTLGAGAAAGGIYAGAGRLLGPLLFLSSSLALVGAPWLARARTDPAVLRREERRISLVAIALCIAPLAAAAVGPVIVPWLLGDQYEASGSVFAILAVGAALSTLSQGLALMLQNRGEERFVGVTITIGLITGLVVTYAAAAFGGAVWAAVGFVVSQLYIVSGLALRMLGSKQRAEPGAGITGPTRHGGDDV